MKKSDIEIPYVQNRGKRYRFFEILPGALTWTIIILPFIVSLYNPRIVVFILLMYLLLWFAKSMGLIVRNFQGLKVLHTHQKLKWSQMLKELETGKAGQPDRTIPAWHYKYVRKFQEEPDRMKPSDIYHAVIVATWNESREVLEPTIQYLLDSDFDMKKVIFVLAFEERGGEAVEKQAKQLMKDFEDKFYYAFAAKHPDGVPGEMVGKGSNITFAARKLEQFLEKRHIDPLNVIVTTLDADNRPHKQYLNALTYTYVVSPDPLHASYQPIPMYTNNIWDAPAPMRVIATGNSFWNVTLSMRPHMLRNFSSHAQSMAALIDTDYWSVRTIVEDGHQFWRTYFRYDGNHEVYPIYTPIYQDAVLARTYPKTLRMQFVQLRRWAWGCSDIAYVAEKGFFTPNKVPKIDMIFKFLRLLEGHVSWSTAPLILAFAGYIPLLLNPDDYASNQLPFIASRVQTVALVGVFVTMFLSMRILPPKPARYKRHRTLFMIVQWVFLPVTSILYNSLAALNAQTRLMFKRYLGKFDITEKTVITDSKQKVTDA
jgi:cellulose synthase/poly-beta-1,6-N-acetylglucosamine synthase-like glycosyltransferase